MIRQARPALFEDNRRNRIPEELFSMVYQPEPKPTNEENSSHRCPFCDQNLSHKRSTILWVFTEGIRHLFRAIVMICSAVIRLVRFIVAAAFCLVGLIGSGCRSIGIFVAHPDDRRFLSMKTSVLPPRR